MLKLLSSLTFLVLTLVPVMTLALEISEFDEWSQEKTLILSNGQWVGLLVALFLGLLARTLVQLVLQQMQRLSSKFPNSFTHILEQKTEKPLGLMAAAGVWYAALNILKIQGNSYNTLFFIIQLIFFVSLIWAGYRLADAVGKYLHHFAKQTDNTFDDHLAPLVAKSLRFFVVLVGVLLALQSFGVNVMSLLAGLGLGGLAFALAAKDTAANLFGSIMIFVDQPFKIGDWIIADGAEGTVKEIGFRSTRIKTFYDSEVSIPNSALANATIDNMGRRTYRRIKAMLGVTYDTSSEKIEQFVEGIKQIIADHPNTRKDYYHVVFHSYGDFSLNIMLYCFLEVPDWSQELLQRQDIYLKIQKLAESLGVEFAFPTQTLHVASNTTSEALLPGPSKPQT